MPPNSAASERAARSWGPGAGLVDQHGQPMPMLPPPGPANDSGGTSGGSDLGARVGTLESDVKTLRAYLGVVTLAGAGCLVGVFLTLDNRINDRFDKSDTKIEKVGDALGEIKIDNARNFERILARPGSGPDTVKPQ